MRKFILQKAAGSPAPRSDKPASSMSRFFASMFTAIASLFDSKRPTNKSTVVARNSFSATTPKQEITGQQKDWGPSLEELADQNARHITATGKEFFPYDQTNDDDGLCTCDDCKSWEAKFQASTPEERKHMDTYW